MRNRKKVNWLMVATMLVVLAGSTVAFGQWVPLYEVRATGKTIHVDGDIVCDTQASETVYAIANYPVSPPVDEGNAFLYYWASYDYAEYMTAIEYTDGGVYNDPCAANNSAIFIQDSNIKDEIANRSAWEYRTVTYTGEDDEGEYLNACHDAARGVCLMIMRAAGYVNDDLEIYIDHETSTEIIVSVP